MAAKKKVKSIEIVQTTVTTGPIELLSVDYGREDINNIAVKVNEIITKVNNS